MENNKTTINCYLTSCKYNTACCITAEGEHHCTKNTITIDIDKEDKYSTEFGCVSFVNGEKEMHCIECLMEQNDGEIPLDDDDELELEFVDSDDEKDW